MTVRQILFVFSFLGILCSDSFSASVPETSPVYTMVKVSLDPGESALVATTKMIDGMPALVFMEALPIDGGMVFTGPPGFYNVLITKDGGFTTPLTTRIVGDGPPNPNPNPNPNPIIPPDPVAPDLKGFALEVYQKAKAVNQPDIAQALAGNYRKVYSALAAGAYTDRDLGKIRLAINALNEKTVKPNTGWTEFGKWIGMEANARSTTLDQCKEFFLEAANGLEAVK